MKKGLCYIIFVIDRSGSMHKIKNDMIGGFNSFIAEQKRMNIGECRVFAYEFNTKYKAIFEDKNIKDVQELTECNYIPSGNTALHDSLGLTINNIGELLSNIPEVQRPEKVLVVTITDGEDNDNLQNLTEHYTLDTVRNLVKHQTEKYNWDFVYMGANQDAWKIGGSMGIANNSNYVATSAGTAYAFQNLAKSTVKYRGSLCSAGNEKTAFSFVDAEQKS